MTGFFDGVERAQLCDLLDEVGPDAPTLLDGWTTRDLAAHLVVREHHLVVAPGLVVPGPWARAAERRRLGLRTSNFAQLVETVRAGPPRGFFRLRWVRRFPNLNEYFVHHEDVRRTLEPTPRAIPDAEQEVLFDNVSRMPWFLARRLRSVGLELEWTGTERVVRARRGSPVVRVRGLPGELLLFQFGRGDVADVEIDGPPDATAALRSTRFGM